MKKIFLMTACLLSISLCCSSCKQTAYKDEANKNLDGRNEVDVSGADGNAGKTKETTMPVTFVNNTGVDIYYLYASTTDTDDWEEDILDVDVLEYGDYVRVDFTFPSTDTIWDFAVEDNSDNRLEFYDLDFSKYGKKGAAIVLNSDGTANITKDADGFELPEVSFTYEEIYDPLLSVYYDMLDNGVTAEEFQEQTGSDLCFAYGMELDLNSVGYTFLNLEGDGIPELAIGFTQGGALSLEGEVTYGIFTNLYGLDGDGNYEEMATSGRSQYCYLCTDGLIGIYTSNIPFSESYIYEQCAGSAVCRVASGELIYDSGKGWYIAEEGNIRMLTSAEAYNIIQSHVPMQINYTPFSQYQ